MSVNFSEAQLDQATGKKSGKKENNETMLAQAAGIADRVAGVEPVAARADVVEHRQSSSRCRGSTTRQLSLPRLIKILLFPMVYSGRQFHLSRPQARAL